MKLWGGHSDHMERNCRNQRLREARSNSDPWVMRELFMTEESPRWDQKYEPGLPPILVRQVIFSYGGCRLPFFVKGLLHFSVEGRLVWGRPALGVRIEVVPSLCVSCSLHLYVLSSFWRAQWMFKPRSIFVHIINRCDLRE